jgi:hypothetical protein
MAAQVEPAVSAFNRLSMVLLLIALVAVVVG